MSNKKEITGSIGMQLLGMIYKDMWHKKPTHNGSKIYMGLKERVLCCIFKKITTSILKGVKPKVELVYVPVDHEGIKKGEPVPDYNDPDWVDKLPEIFREVEDEKDKSK